MMSSLLLFPQNVNVVLGTFLRDSLVAQMVKNPPANPEGLGLIPGLERSPGGGNGNSLQCSCLENPMDRGALWTTVHGGHKKLDVTE